MSRDGDSTSPGSNLANEQRDLQFWRGQVLSRRGHLLKNFAPWTALGLGLLLAALLQVTPGSRLSISYAVGNALSFASIAMGACFSSIILSIGLPGARRLRRWANFKGRQAPGKSALSDLIFTLAWAGLSQLGLIAVCVLANLFGGDFVLAPTGMHPLHTVSLWLALSVFVYAVLELFVVVQTLVQIGVLVIFEEQKLLDDGEQ